MTSNTHRTTVTITALIGLTLGFAAPAALAQPGWVLSHQKISDAEGGFTGILDDSDFFGISAASLGDLDGDGVGDLAVGANWDDDGGQNRGAVWVLFLNTDGTVKSHQKISDTEGGFTGVLDDHDYFGFSLASLNDLDGDGVGDLAVGARRDGDGGLNRGAVWVLFLNTDGTVKSHQKISDTAGGFTGVLDDGDWFGASAAALNDLDGDGVGDLAVGARRDDDGGLNRGAVWLLFLNTDGTVKSHQKISDTAGGFTGVLDDGDWFGASAAALGDLDGDGVDDLAVGARLDDDGGGNRGAVWVLFLNTDGTVKSHQKISDTEGGFTGVLDDGDLFSVSVASLGDLDSDGVGDLAVGAHHDDDGGENRGAVWVLFLNPDGTVKRHQKISDTEGGFKGILDDRDNFGFSLASLNDLDGDGVDDLAVGAIYDDDGGQNRGAVWVLFLDGVSACPADLDGSGAVDFGDILAILGAWGDEGGPEDLDDSGFVDFGDLLIVLSEWGPCPQPTGACCLDDGSCTDDVEEGDCLGMNGLYQGYGSRCVDGCPVGACCFDESCVDNVTERGCDAMGGSYQGEGSTCADNCFGACCFPDETCTDNTAEAGCIASGGVFQGGGTVCTEGCPFPCGHDVEAPLTWTGELCGEGSSCTLRQSDDIRWQVRIPEAGDWTFSACAPVQIGLYVDTRHCCGAEHRTLSTCDSIEVRGLAAGQTVFVTVEAALGCGEFTLEITGP